MTKNIYRQSALAASLSLEMNGFYIGDRNHDYVA